MIRKVVITAAGLGTRLLPMSKELPKEMMPIFLKSDDSIVLKPLLQALFEQLYDSGFREFCFIVGRGKRAIEDHFTPDWRYVELLEKSQKTALADELRSFYKVVEMSRILWMNQSEPRGFGHAVSMAESFVNGEPFLTVAGDTFIIPDSFLERMKKTFDSKNPLAVLLLQKIPNPEQYGVAIIDGQRVLGVVEKPEHPPSNYAIMPFYIFNPIIFQKLLETNPDVKGEIQLTDAIQKLVESGQVEAVPLGEDESRLDIGTPETYWQAIKTSYELVCKDK